MIKRSGNGSEIARDPLRVARQAVESGHFREAWDELSGVSSSLKDSPEWKLLASMASWRLGRFAQSRSMAEQARDRYRALGDVDGEMRAENVSAAGAFALGDLAGAERGFARARTLAEQLRDELMAARCANNLGNVAHYWGRDIQALSFYSLAATGFENVHSLKGLGESWHNTGTVLRVLEQLSGARSAYDRAIRLAQELEDERLLAQALSGQGETLTLGGDLRLARVQVRRALGLARAHDDHLTEIDALRVSSLIEERSGDKGKALEYVRNALKVAREVSHPWMIATVQRRLGELYRSINMLGEAGAAFREAAAAYDKLGSVEYAGQMREKGREVSVLS